MKSATNNKGMRQAPNHTRFFLVLSLPPPLVVPALVLTYQCLLFYLCLLQSHPPETLTQQPHQDINATSVETMQGTDTQSFLRPRPSSRYPIMSLPSFRNPARPVPSLSQHMPSFPLLAPIVPPAWPSAPPKKQGSTHGRITTRRLPYTTYY